ncbi:MAG: helix-turn-helix transcriptional regulator [Clostridia bacterium]|nr:helix-turn-helix transcriptional regulator [Clostridia bacterium]
MSFKDIRIKANLTQKELANNTGLSIRYISLLEKHQRNPSDKTKLILAKALGVSPVEIFLIFNSTECSKIKA